jgi:hypothetical protein
LPTGAGVASGLVTIEGLAGLATEAGGAAFAIAGVSVGFLPIAFNTSPGFDILEKSNFGLASSVREVVRESSFLPLLTRRSLRTRSASSSSKELEWVFFSVTPTLVSTSSTALLFTSSSLAKSLIRTFDIRYVFPQAGMLCNP